MAIFGIYSQASGTASLSSRLSPFYHSILTKDVRWSQQWHLQGNVLLSSSLHQVQCRNTTNSCMPKAQHYSDLSPNKTVHAGLPMSCCSPWVVLMYSCPAGRVASNPAELRTMSDTLSCPKELCCRIPTSPAQGTQRGARSCLRPQQGEGKRHSQVLARAGKRAELTQHHQAEQDMLH